MIGFNRVFVGNLGVCRRKSWLSIYAHKRGYRRLLQKDASILFNQHISSIINVWLVLLFCCFVFSIQSLTRKSYSLILLFFIECYIFIKTKTDKYMAILYGAHLFLSIFFFFPSNHFPARYCSHFCIMSLVFLFFIVDKYVFCNREDPTLPSIGNTVEDFNIAVSVMRLAFFLSTGVVRYFFFSLTPLLDSWCWRFLSCAWLEHNDPRSKT